MAIPLSKRIERIKSTRFTMIPTRAIFDPDLSPKEKDLLGVLAAMQGTKQFCWPSLKMLCEEIFGIDYKQNRRNMQHRLATLEQRGYIRRKEDFIPKVGAQKSNLIYVLFEPSHTYVPDPEEYLGDENDEDDNNINDLEVPPPAVGIYHPPAVGSYHSYEKEEGEKEKKKEKERKKDLSTTEGTNTDSPTEECSLPRGLPHSSGAPSESPVILTKDVREYGLGSMTADGSLTVFVDGKKVDPEGIPFTIVHPPSTPLPGPQNLSTKTVDNPVHQTVEMPFWGQVLGDLVKRVGQPLVTSWYGRLLFQGISNKCVMLKCPNAYFANYLEHGPYKAEIIKSMKAFGKEVSSVKFTL